MEYRKMMLSFLKLLVEKRGIEVEPTGIIRVKGRELKIVELDIKVNELFDKEYFLNHMMENGIGFDVLDFYIEEAFEFMEEIKKKINQHIMIMLKIEECIIQDKYFMSWIEYIKEICSDFKINPADIIVEVKSSREEQSEINIYREMKGIEKIREYGFKVALSSINRVIERLEEKYIEIIDTKQVDINIYKNRQKVSKSREVIIRGKADIGNLEEIEYDYIQIEEKL